MVMMIMRMRKRMMLRRKRMGVRSAAAAVAVAAAAVLVAAGSSATRTTGSLRMCVGMCVHVSLRLRSHALQQVCVRRRQLLLQRHDQLHAGDCLGAHLAGQLRQIQIDRRLRLLLPLRLPRGVRVRVQIEALVVETQAAAPHRSCMSCMSCIDSMSSYR